MDEVSVCGYQQGQTQSCQGGIFVPVQDNAEVLPPDQALMIGTAFACLHSPYENGEKYDG